MIQSMTAFARVQRPSLKGQLVCELRSINHRYLEISLRLPDILHEFEAAMRERLRTSITRGKVECYIRLQHTEVTDASLHINKDLAKKVCAATEEIAAMLQNPAPVNTISVLHWPGILDIPKIDAAAIKEDVFSLLDDAIKELVAARQREGEQLNKLFFQRLDAMQTETDKVTVRLPTILANQKQRLLTRFAEAKVELDNNRLEQELLLFAHKIDVTEELDRLATHCQEVRRVLSQTEATGRRLDFLMQELNREANTLGSKSVDAETTRVAVELKVLIEQMREQVQNVE